MKEKIYGIAFGLVVMGFLTLTVIPMAQAKEDVGDKYSKSIHTDFCYAADVSVGAKGVELGLKYSAKGDHGAGIAIAQKIEEKTAIKDGYAYDYPVDANAQHFESVDNHDSFWGTSYKYIPVDVDITDETHLEADNNGAGTAYDVVTGYNYEIQQWKRSTWPGTGWEQSTEYAEYGMDLNQNYFVPDQGGPFE